MNIGIDFDGVVADCGKLKREGARRLYGVDIPEEKFKKEIVIGEGLLTLEEYRTVQKEIYGTRELGLLAEMVPDAKKYIEQLQKEGYALTVVTSRGEQELIIAKEWTQKHGIHLPFIGVGGIETKEAACRELELAAYVDDDLDKLCPLSSCVPHLFLFSWGYNNSEIEGSVATRVFSWADFYQKIKELQ